MASSLSSFERIFWWLVCDSRRNRNNQNPMREASGRDIGIGLMSEIVLSLRSTPPLAATGAQQRTTTGTPSLAAHQTQTVFKHEIAAKGEGQTRRM